MINNIFSHKITVTFIVFYTLAGCLSVVLNIIEIHLIRKTWKKATNFELILLHLAFADLLTGLINLAKCGILSYVYATDDYKNSLISYATLVLVVPVTSSALFVIVIGMERLMAIKAPLKHRYHSSSRNKTVRIVIVTWTVSIVITTLLILCGTIWHRNISLAGSKSTIFTLTIGIIMTVCMCIMLTLYSWIGCLLLRRDAWLFKFNSENSITKSFISAIQKERASIIVCTLVVVSYLALNIPFSVFMFLGNLREISVVLVAVNSVVNPIIYFLKGYMEKYFAKQKIEFISAQFKEPDKEKTQSRETVVESET